MSDDLISRSALINPLKKHIEEISDTDIVEVYEDFIKYIEQQKTAYDADEVVEQLEELAQNEYDREGECGYGFVDGVQIYNDGVSKGKYGAYLNSLKIVKAGGVNE